MTLFVWCVYIVWPDFFNVGLFLFYWVNKSNKHLICVFTTNQALIAYTTNPTLLCTFKFGKQEV